MIAMLIRGRIIHIAFQGIAIASKKAERIAVAQCACLFFSVMSHVPYIPAAGKRVAIWSLHRARSKPLMTPYASLQRPDSTGCRNSM
jgi:hypothetical protein